MMPYIYYKIKYKAFEKEVLYFLTAKTILLLALIVFSSGKAAYGAVCSDVFPVNTTSNATTSQQFTYSYPSGQAFSSFWYLLPNSVGTGDQYYYGRSMVSDILVTPGLTTRLFINGNLSLNRGFIVDADVNESGNPEDLIIIIKGDLSISNKATINALIYVEGDVSISGNPTNNGAITATGSAPAAKTKQTYDAAAVANANFGTLCSSGVITFDHFDINIPANSSTCFPTSVVITAIDSSGATMTSYTDTLSLTTSSGHGGWAVSTGTNGIVDSNADDGAATYTFDAADSGVVTLALTNAHADVMTTTATDVTSSVSSTSSSTTFNDNAFSIAAFNSDVIAGRDHSFGIEYIKRDPSTGSCGVAADFSANVNLKMSYGPSINHPVVATAPVVNTVTLPTSQPASNNVALNFIAGVSSFTLSTSDIGEYQLNVLDNSSGLAVDTSGNPINISGSSAVYSIRPFGIDVTLPGNPAATSAAGGIFKIAGELFDIQARGVLYEASDDLDSDGIPDGHDDIDPTNNANLSNNGVAPSFGGEGETISLSAVLALPVGGNDPGLNGTILINSFSSGAGSTGSASSFDEVGIIEVSAGITDGTYLSSTGITLYGKSGYVGRFTPAYFSASSNAPLLLDGWYDSNSDSSNNWTCDFTYQGQEFAMDVSPRMTVAAVNTAGVAVQNYTGAFNKFTVSSVSQKNIQFAVQDNGATTATVPSVNNTVAITMNDLGGGLIDFTLSGLADLQNGIFYNKSVQASSGDEVFSADFSVRFFEALDDTSPSPALTVGNPGDAIQPITFVSDLQDYFDDASYLNTDTNGDGSADSHQGLILQDGDNICYKIDSNADGIPDLCDEYTLSGISGTEIRYGRLSLENAYGSELLPLLMVFRVEYYDLITVGAPTSGFKVNDQDNNSASACSGTLVNSAAISLSDFQLNLNVGETSVSSVSGLSDGLGNLVLSAPGAGNQGMVKVNITVPNWLKYDFDGDGIADQSSGIASFGVSAGDDLLFFQQESFR
ncbi:MAG: hypothetical protein JKY01_00520 [Pseudomonadales bacterium]|nr:hypothetical protein [Pseudomonadales bacterium]